MMRVLLLGGTSEANALAGLLAGQGDISAIMSFAGRTAAPRLPAIPYRVGGFGGVDGLLAYLQSEGIEVLIDATHPFAEQISRHAAIAAGQAGIPLIHLSRPAWIQDAGDHWIEVPNMAAAATALGTIPKRVFLTIGRLQIGAFEAAPQHFYLIRSIEPIMPAPNLPSHQIILTRGRLTQISEEQLLRDYEIEIIVTKNSGGDATHAKILAARHLGLPVIMVARPASDLGPALEDPAQVMRWLRGHQKSLVPRGV